MADNRVHDYYVFQDLDLFENSIKNVKEIKSVKNKDLDISSKTTNLKSDVDVTGTQNVGGKATFQDDVEICNNKSLTLAATNESVEIKWDTVSHSLVFVKKINA